MIKEAILSTVWMGYGDDEIMRIRVKENAHIDPENVRLQYKTIHHLAGTTHLAVMLDVRANFTTTKEAQTMLAEMSKDRIATAVITNNPVSRALINTYISVFKPASPYKLFSEESKALDWLKEMKNKAQSKKG